MQQLEITPLANSEAYHYQDTNRNYHRVRNPSSNFQAFDQLDKAPTPKENPNQFLDHPAKEATPKPLHTTTTSATATT